MLSSRSALPALALLGLIACGSSDGGGNGSGSDDAGQRIDASSPVQDDAGSPAEVVRFVAMGDTGTASETQYAIGEAVAEVCETRGCDFVLLLGDNFYDSGVDSVDDPLWESHFEMPYAGISNDIPFYPVLGNHDYGGTLGGELLPVEQGGLGNEFEKGPLEVEYTDYSDKWTMPATFYTLRVGNVGIIMLDTNSIMWDDTSNGDQEAWYPTALEEVAGADWVLAAGHHPYLSNGTHGNAGSYESIEVADVPIPNPVPLLNGNNIKSFFDDYVCGTIDLYLNGHDHNRQWIDEPEALCGAPMITSGAGAKVRELGAGGNNALFEDASEAGFAYVVVDGPDLTLQFMDAELNIDFEQTISLP